MIRFTTVATQTVLLLTLSLLAPLHSAGEAPACGGAGGEYSAAPPVSARRSTPSTTPAQAKVEDIFLRCKKAQQSLLEQFPVLTADAIPSEPLLITPAQLEALNGAGKVLKIASQARLHACDVLADNITLAMRSVFLTDTSDDAMELKQVIAAYNKARNLRIRLSPEQRLPNQARCLISHFLPAADQLALAQTSRQWGESFQQNIGSIASKIRISRGIELTDDERMLCAQPIIKTSQQPDTEGFYNISLSTEGFYGIPLPIAMKLLTNAIIANDAAKIAILKPLVDALIDQHHAQYLIAFDNAKTALEIIAPTQYFLTKATDLLATIDKGDLLNRIALSFAWYHRFPHTCNMDTDIRLNQIITKERFFDEYTLNFASIKALPRCEAITQLIIDFVLSVIKPTKLTIDESCGAVTIISYELRYLIIFRNHQLKALNVSNCPQLKTLDCDYCPLLTALDFSNCPRLQKLSTGNNPLLTALDVSPCPQLEKLHFDACPLLTVLGLSNCSQLKELCIGSNPWLTTLDLSCFPQLQSLYCHRCPLLTALDLSNCPLLEILYASRNPGLTALDLSNCTLLKTLYAPPVATLDLSMCSQLACVDVSDNPRLTVLDLSNCSQLYNLKACGNPWLTTLDLSNCTNLDRLKVDNSNKRLTDVTLENTPRLWLGERKYLEDLVADNRARIRE